jgi:hypothetical protein
MALPLAPLAVVAVKYGTIALAGYALARQIQPGRTSQPVEEEMDDLPEGVTAHRPRDREQLNAAARFRRTIRLGTRGPGFELDASLLGRFRMRRI